MMSLSRHLAVMKTNMYTHTHTHDHVCFVSKSMFTFPHDCV